MTPDLALFNRLYESVGFLFYAVISVDKNVRQEEVDELNRIINDKRLDYLGLPVHFDLDATLKVKQKVERLLDQDYSSEECFKNFKEFYYWNKEMFNKDLRLYIFHTAVAIVEAVAGKNKSELGLLTKLKILFED
jgi:hypothetical protein